MEYVEQTLMLVYKSGGWKKAMDVLVRALQDVKEMRRIDVIEYIESHGGSARAPPPPFTNLHLIVCD